jgi:hypothetical protein
VAARSLPLPRDDDPGHLCGTLIILLVRRCCLHQPDPDRVGPDLDASDPRRDQVSLGQIGSEPGPEIVGDELFDLGGGDTPDGSSLSRMTIDQWSADIVAVTRPAFPGVGWAHHVATVIIQLAGQERAGSATADRLAVALFGELRLDDLEQFTVQNGGVLGRMDGALEDDLADVEAVAEQVGERAPGERDPAPDPNSVPDQGFGHDPALA